MLTQEAKRLKLHKSVKGKAADEARKKFQEEQEKAQLIKAAEEEFGEIIENLDDLKKIKAKYDQLKKAAIAKPAAKNATIKKK